MKEFFHVDRVTGRLSPRQEISLLYSQNELNELNVSTNRAFVFKSMFTEGVSQHGWEYLLKDERPIPSEDTLGMIEIMAEYVRRSHYPQFISRFQSFFAFNSVAEAERFISLFPSTDENGAKRYRGDIWLVQCRSAAFIGDMTFLGLGDCWLDAITKMHLYWQGQMGDNGLIEVLLKPPIMVVEKVKTVLDRSQVPGH